MCAYMDLHSVSIVAYMGEGGKLVCVLHPVAVTEPIRPADIGGDGPWIHVPGGARAADSRADALVRLDDAELARRARYRLGAVTSSTALLDALLTLPVDMPVRMCDVEPDTAWSLKRAPEGVVDFDGPDWVIRRLTPPLTVGAAITYGSRWGAALGRVGIFVGYCQAIAVFKKPPKDFGSYAWEATFSGIGVWVGEGSETVEAVAPQLHVCRRWEYSGWLFLEKAFSAYLDSRRPEGLSSDLEGRQSRTAYAASCQPELPFPEV